MTWDLATAKARLGITGTAQDVEIQAALDGALALAEAYCDRHFLSATETEEFTHFDGTVVSLKRYPLQSIASMTDALGAAVTDSYHLDKKAGLIKFDSYRFVRHLLTVEYTGGYTALPPGLELALWGTFDAVWADGLSAGGGIAAGTVQSITSEGQTVRFFAPSAAAAAVATSVGLIPATWIGVLDLYRREKA